MRILIIVVLTLLLTGCSFFQWFVREDPEPICDASGLVELDIKPLAPLNLEAYTITELQAIEREERTYILLSIRDWVKFNELLIRLQGRISNQRKIIEEYRNYYAEAFEDLNCNESTD